MSYEDFDYLGIWTKPQQKTQLTSVWNLSCGLADRSDSGWGIGTENSHPIT